MFFALGAASSAIDLLSSLGSSSSSSSTTGKNGFVPANAFSLPDPTAASTATGGSGGSQLAPTTWNTLLAAQAQGQTGATSRSAALDDLFSQIDGDGDGKISQTEFEDALGAGGTNLQMADDVFKKMDLNGDGTISKDEMSQSLAKSRGHHHHHAGGAGGDALMQALQGATSTSETNSDGSTTTTLTYADGTKITMTQPAASSSDTSASTGNNAIQSYNFTERLIQRQAQWLAANAQPSLSMSA